MMNKFIKYFSALFPLVVLVVVTVVFYFFISPVDLVDYIGVDNAYVLMYIFALCAGLTTFNTVPYYSILFILANSSVNPVILGLSSALGVMTGDSFSYFIGRQGGGVLPEKTKKIFDYILSLALNHPRAFPIFCFVYGSISPFSNDLITVPSGLAKIPYYRVIIPLAVGNIVFNIALAFLSVYAYDYVGGVFGI